jgi:hypothetical protein
MRAQKSVCINIYTYINYSVGSIVLIIKVRNSSTSYDCVDDYVAAGA